LPGDKLNLWVTLYTVRDKLDTLDLQLITLTTVSYRLLIIHNWFKNCI